MNQREKKAEKPFFMRNKFLNGAALMRLFEKVKIFVLSLVLLCAIEGYAQWDTVYVDMGRPAGGDGQSWVSAFNELDTAISYNPDTNLVILCAEGTYYPKAAKGKFQRNSKKGFKIIGGYPRLSTNNSKSNPDIFKVILDGDIDKNDLLMPDSTCIINGNNASTVLYLGGYGDCWFEGLTFQHGDNNSGNGGGLYVKGKTSLLKCQFYRNRAMNGGAICSAGWDTLKIDSCIFQNNNSTDTTKRTEEHIDELDGGGAIYANAKIIVSWSKFLKNHSENAGGAICIHDDNLLHSTGNKFISNSAMSFGGAIYSRVQTVISIDDSISNNTAARGGGGMLSYNSIINMNKVVFENNKSGQHGGALVLGSNGILRNCNFVSNNADSCGGALYANSNSDSGILIYNSNFKNNKTNLHGGAMYILSGPFFIKDSSSFEGNRAFQNGGALFLNDTFNIVLQVTNTLFKSDSAVYGGAIYSAMKQMDSCLISHCKFQLNKAFNSYAVSYQKGGIFRNCLIFSNSSSNGCIIAGKSIDSTGPVIRECTIVKNLPVNSKVVEYIPLIKNTIIWNGHVGDSCDTVKYSIIQNWTGGGAGNMSIDPKLSIREEYKLTGGSPAIDMGDFDTSGVSEFDLNGKVRIRGRYIDIGAYEHYGKIYVDSRATGDNNGSSWGHAYKNLHDALYYSGDGDTIWVAKGVYKAGYSSYTNNYINVIKNVKLIGGFRGDETYLSQRDWRSNITTLTGEISPHYFAYNVIKLMDSSVVDGFRIIKSENSACYLDSSDNATIRNCIISNNFTSNYGSAITITNSDNVLIENCFISNNIANGPGVAGIGAVNCNNLNIRNCILSGNSNSNISNVSAALFKNSNLTIVNCTFSANNNRTLLLDTSSAILINNIIWNDSTDSDTLIQLNNSSFYARNCDIRKGISGIKKDGSSIITNGGELFNLNPQILDATSNKVDLTKNSPCIDHGSVIDTSGWGIDIEGNRRIFNNKIDIGALEFQGIVVPEPPAILPTLDTFSIPANGNITIDLNRKKNDGTGYYVFYSFRDISELTWKNLTIDTNVTVTINPDNNQIKISISPAYRPGDMFNLKLQAADPEITQAKAEKNVLFKVINPGFEICQIAVSQNDTGKDFSGTILVKNTIDPIYLSRGRIFITDTVHGSIQNLQYIDGINLTETIRPASRGGSVDCGVYSFSFNSTSSIVYNSNGISTGRTLYEWATDSMSRYPGSIYYKNHKKIKLLFLVSNGLSDAQERIVEIPVDFDAPLTTIRVSENSPHKQKIKWEPFKETLSALTLIIIPQGENAPATDTFNFSPSDLSRIEYVADSIQDSRTFRYILRAQDKRGNIGESQVVDSTPSDFYTISGIVNSINVPADSLSGVKISLYSLFNDKPSELFANQFVLLDSSFQFTRVPNGKYIVEIGECKSYYAIPVQDSLSINRKNVSGLTFDVSPEPVANYDAFRVEQLENSGDLKITVKTNILFSGEKPVKVMLHWEGGDSAIDSGSQEFDIATSTFCEIKNSDGSAIWSFIISRQDIEDSILNRKGGFTDHVRYYNSRLMTSAFGYSVFRYADWEYPVKEGNLVLYADQRFVKPEKPLVSKPKVSCTDAHFLIRNISPGPGMKAHVRFEKKFGPPQVIDTSYSMPNVSTTVKIDGRDMIICPFDWNYTSRYKIDSLGRKFLSGYFIDSVSVDTSIARIGSGFTKYGNTWIPGKESDTIPYASWKINVADFGNYWAWIFVDRKADSETKVIISIGDVNNGSKIIFKVNKGSSGWIPLALYKTRDQIELMSGTIDVNLFYPNEDISVSALAFMKVPYKNSSRPTLRSELRDSIVPWGGLYPSKQARDFNLETNTLYTLKIWASDRYGNISDTVYFDSVHTQQQYFSGKIAIHEEPVTGDLSFSLKQPVSDAEYLDSIIFRFNGQEHSLALHQKMNQTGPTLFQIPRSMFSDLIKIDDFKRHTVYDSLFFVFSSDTSYTVKTTITYQCNPCNYSHCSKLEKLFASIGIYKATCIFSQTEHFIDTIQTARIPLSWPDGSTYHVSSQEYRQVTEPILDFKDTTSRSVMITCSNLNTDTNGFVKEQMSGQLNVFWTPGSNCEDTTRRSFSFGNRFTMRGNWISFVPSFEGSINSNVGEWRISGSNGTRHQWIDRFDGVRPRLGGEFYPNIGDSISPVKIMTDPGSVPSLSMGIYLTSTQASSSSDSTQRFNLWVLPSKVNGSYNSSFYWGIDGNPDTVNIGNVFNYDSITPSWIRGPSKFLSEGNHTIDLYMKADGAGIAAVALSKDTAYPPIDLDSLSRWGNYGFDIEFEATEIPSNNDITFCWQAVDRFGNVSSIKEQVVRTKEFDEPIPIVVITPDMPLENGYYHSIYPSFTVSVSNNIADSLNLQAVLMINNGLHSDSISLLNTTLIDTAAYIWSVSVDSNHALSPFPDTGGITPKNSYAIRARVIKSNGKEGDWTQLLFGVKADSSEIPPSVALRDSMYQPHSLSFKFLRGLEVAANKIIGDLEILFDFENTSGKKLVLEGATIYTDTSMDSGVIIHEKIDSIYGGKIACYECDDYNNICSRSSSFSFPYGKFMVEISAESLSVQQYGNEKKIRSPKNMIRDDNGSYVRLSSAYDSSIRITRYGIIDTCYSINDRFFLKNVKKYGNIHDGFHIDACRVIFSRDTATETYTLFTSGTCDSCGPDLKFTVLNPRYLDEEFTVFDKLDNPLTVTYTDSIKEYDIDFGTSGNYVSASRCDNVKYCGWDLKFNSYAFNEAGVQLTDFSIGLHEETFPKEKNGGTRFIDHFGGTLINGDPGFNDGALHFSGIAFAPGVNICSSNDYLFTAIDTIKFAPDGTYDYKMNIPDICTLAVPSYKNKNFNENDTVRIQVMADSGFVLGADGLEKVNASGEFIRSIGKRNGSNVFTINGILSVRYAARDFQLNISQNGTDSIFIIDKGFFSDALLRSDHVYIAKGSIGFFSDFSINTLYGKKDGPGNYPVKPAQFEMLNIPSKGFEIFKTSNDSIIAGIRILLLAPGFEMNSLNELFNITESSSCSFDPAIYNAGFDLNGNLTNISGRIELPENMLSCYGIRGMEKIGEQIASFKLKTLYIGYENYNEDLFKIGADASISLGKMFDKIGLQGEKISLSKLTVGYSDNWFIGEMHASAFPLPRLIGIGPKNYRKSGYGSPEDSISKQISKDSVAGINYLELYTGGSGFRLDYVRGENLTLDLKNWSLRITENFPFKPLRGVSFLLKKFKFEKNLSPEGGDGNITELEATAQYIPPGGAIKIGDVEFYNTKFALGYDKEENIDSTNSTKVNAYISVTFDTLRIGNKIFQMVGNPGCETGFKIYFDGTYDVKGCLVWRDTIGIVPWGEENNPRIFIDPGTAGTEVSISIKSNEGFSASLRNVWLRSRDTIPGLDTILAVDVNKLSIQFKDRKFCLKTLDVSWWIYKKLIDNNAFKLVVNRVDFGYAKEGKDSWGEESNSGRVDLKNKFWMISQTDVSFKPSKCKIELKPELGFVVNTKASEEEQRKLNVIWKVNGGFECDIGNMAFGAKFKLANDTIGFDTAFLNMNNLKEHFDNEDVNESYRGKDIGVTFYNAYWIKNSINGKWEISKPIVREKRENLDKFYIVPRFRIDKKFNICGLTVCGSFNFGRLFRQPYPGIGFENIRVASPRLGKDTIPLCMNLYLDGRKPFIHPEFDSPKKIPISIPSIELTPEISLGEAYMEFGVDKLPGSQEESWYFSGEASMNLKGAIDKVEVKVSFEKPSPPQNCTGIRYAKITIKMAGGCRIPIGSTPLFISGFEGAIYDGYYMPDGAMACNIPSLPPGLKVEAAMFVELEDPALLNGKTGFWVHLRKLNFGLNGEVEALQGIADANACLALYNNGKAFHGEFNVLIHLGLMAKGRFVIDIWKDESGGNFTAEASSAIGLSRGALINRKLIKIPRNDRWFMELLTKAGKFSNEKNGVATGLRFFGRSWGIGVIGGKFSVGNMGKFQLKQSPVISASLPKMAMARTAIPDMPLEPDVGGKIRYINPGFKLEGGEIISFVAATDDCNFEWPENVLRVVDAESKEIDFDSADYIPFEGQGNDTTKELFVNDENAVARLWVNNRNYDSILLILPDIINHSSEQPHGGFEFMFFAGLKPARIENFSATVDDTAKTNQVTFNGSVSNFRGRIRNLIRIDSTNTDDTLLKQKMRLKLYYSSISPRPSDTTATKNYFYNLIEIPISQFDGYNESHSSLLDNPNVYYDSINDSLTITNLIWNTDKTAPGKYALRAAVEVIDFVTEDGNGNKIILPLDKEDEAPVFKENPVVITYPGNSDPVIFNIVNNLQITKPVGFTATGSEADTNWNKEDETRSIFLRWHMDYNHAVHGYQISWYPSNVNDSLKNVLKRSVFVGKTNNYTITIPDLTANDSIYTDDCSMATGEAILICDTVIDSTVYKVQTSSVTSDYIIINTDSISDTIYFKHVVEYDTSIVPESTVVQRPNRLCPSMIDTAYYKASAFDVIITPVVNTTYMYTDSVRGGISYSAIKSEIYSEFSDTIFNAKLAANNGASSNRFKLKLKQNLSTIEVPLNEAKVVDAKILILGKDTTDNASRYGELWAKVINSSVPANAMPKAGFFNNYFTINDDSIDAMISIKPVEKNMTCKEMFGSTCRKVKVDSVGKYADSTSYQSCISGCPADTGNSDYKQLKMADPCHGESDSLVIRRTPFDTYKMYLYAINNGRRRNPVYDTTGGYAVYDSLLFRVIPPKPILHGISPHYILHGREDSLSLAVSNLWIDSTAAYRPGIRIRWYDKLKTAHDTIVTITNNPAILKPMVTGERKRDWKLQTNAEWEVRLSTIDLIKKSNNIDTTAEFDLFISIINRDKDVHNSNITCISNEFRVSYVFDPNSIECPEKFYDPDAPNASYLMDWIGNYPKDSLSPNDSLYIRFTELHDLNPAHYSVKLIRYDGTGSDTTNIYEFKIDYSGISLKLPDTLRISGEKNYEVVTSMINGPVSKCLNRTWSNRFSTVQEREYRIVKDGNGFRIIAVKGAAYRHLDIIRYAIGKIPSPALVTVGYNHNPPEHVQMSQSNWVTAVIKRKSGKEITIQEWIDIENIPQLYDRNGMPVPDNFEAEPGEKFFIRSPLQAFYEQNQTKPYHCYRFSNNDTVHGDVITIKADSRGPVTIYRWVQTQPGSGGVKKQLEGYKIYNFTLKTFDKDEIVSLIIPSKRILDAASDSVTNYPLLLRIDSSTAPGINTLLAGKNFHFRDALMQPISFDIEHFDTVSNTAEIWVKLPKIDPGTGNNIVNIVSGFKAANPSDVWSAYSAVWHCDGDSALHDATGNAFDIQLKSAVVIKGIIDNSLQLAGQLDESFIGKSLLTENDPGFTVSSWVKLYDFPDSTTPLIMLVNRKNSIESVIAVTADSGLAFIIGSDTLKTISGALEDSIWLNIAVTYDWYNTKGNAAIYVNGLPVTRTESMNNDQRINNIHRIIIAGNSLDITIDELRIAPIAFHRNQISLDYFSQRQRNDFLKFPVGITSVTSVSAPEYRMIPGARRGDKICTNRNWTLETIEPDMVGKQWFIIPWEDRISTKDTLVTVHLNGPAFIYLLLDSRYTSKPLFLSSWRETGRAVSVKGPSDELISMNIYTLQVDSATDVSFGGNRSGGASGGELPWAVLMDLSKDNTGFRVAAKDYPFIRTGTAIKGELLYSDREHEIDSLPEALENGILIQTPNAFRFSDTSSFVAFSVNRPAIASILLDTSYRSWPSFIINDKEWKSSDLRVTSGNKVLSVFQKRVKNSNTFEISGGPHFGNGDGNCCSYSMIIQPDNYNPLIITDKRIVEANTGVLVYTDSLWHIISIPEELKGKKLIKTQQAKYACNDSVYLSFKLLRSCKVYFAIDENQSTPPGFLSDVDSNGSVWDHTDLSIEISNHAKFKIYRKALTDGTYSFSCARYDGGSDDNMQNYFVIVDTTVKIPENTNNADTAEIGKKPYKNIPDAKIVYIPEQLKGLIMIEDSSYTDYCRNQTFNFSQPVRIWLGVDPSFRTSGTFLQYDNWEKTDMIISLSGLPDRVLWHKIFDPGTITIPGVHCDYYQPGVMNPIIIIEYLEAPSRGLYARNLKVTGFGDERRAETENYIVKNLDVVYSYEIEMSSRSWIMNIETRSAIAHPSDTIKVLTPFGDGTVYKINDTTVIRPENQFYLSELMPLMVAVDSVRVNAIDLRAQGIVRVAFKNNSTVSVNKPFVVILFEDRNGDFTYNSYDKRLGSITVNSIRAGEFKLYQINLDDTISFPNRTLFSFIDATDQIAEMDDWNNVGSSGTTCENYQRPVFVEKIDDSLNVGRWGHVDSLTSGLPSTIDSTIFCYIKDFNGDSLIDEDDTLDIVYTYNNRLYAVNALTHDSLFPSIFVGPSAVAKIRVDDFTNDGIPEIVIGNSLYKNNGELIHDFQVLSPVLVSHDILSALDLNRDGIRDTILWDEIDSCTLVRSGRDSTLLFVYPVSKWSGPIDPVTTPVLCDIHQGTYHCYNVNVSFPRYSVTLNDTVDLTVRVANAGTARVDGVLVEMFADTLERDSSLVDGIAELPSDLILIGNAKTGVLECNTYVDIRLHAVLPDSTKRLWFRVDGNNKYFECNERDNGLNIGVR